MDGSCQCGAIRFTTPTSEPLGVYCCHCLECRHQSSSAFGISVVFPAFSLPASVEDNLGRWERRTAAGKALRAYFCKVCGSRIMHATDGGDQVFVKGGCLLGLGKGELDLSKASHIWTKRAIVPIPPGAEQHEEEPPD